MVSKIFTETLIIFLITYALIDILHRIFSIIYKRLFHKKYKSLLIVDINDDDDIEHTIRTTAKKSQEIESDFAIYIKNHTHESDMIISQLSNEYPYMHIIKSFNEVPFDN